MKIKELKEIVDIAYKNGKNNDIEFYIQLEDLTIMCDVESIGQFHVIPDMTLTFKLSDDTKIYSSKPLTGKQIGYRKKCRKLEEKINAIYSILEQE